MKTSYGFGFEDWSDDGSNTMELMRRGMETLINQMFTIEGYTDDRVEVTLANPEGSRWEFVVKEREPRVSPPSLGNTGIEWKVIA